MREIKSHTALRGIAAFLVVFYHYKSNLGYREEISSVTGFFDTADRFVDFFFMLSGFVMGYVYLDRIDGPGEKKAFFISRFSRIYPLHIFTMAIMVGLFLYSGAEISSDVAADFIRNVLLVHAWGAQDAFIFNFPSWSISGEFAAYLMFPVLAAIVVRSAWGQALLVISAIGAVLAEHYLVNVTGLPWERLCLLRAVPLFALGIVLYVRRNLVSSLSTGALSCIQVVATIGILVAMHLSATLIIFLPLFVALIVSTYSDKGVLPRLLNNAPLYGLGLISYTIYMLHVPVRAVGYFIWPKFMFLVPESFRDTAFVAICTVVTLVAGVYIYRLFEMPMRRVLRARLS